jgi:lysophospholipase L1-like esterase
MKKTTFVILVALMLCPSLFAIRSNMIISRGKSVYTSSGTASYLVDNKFGSSSFTVSSNSWIAINVGSGPTKVFVNWNNSSYGWSDSVVSTYTCQQNIKCPINYVVRTSSNSTNGSDGQWTTVASVTNNTVTARGHLVDFSGASWVKLVFSSGGGNIDEVEVFDASSDGDDSWFFPGTSITANSFKSTPPASNFADLITADYPAFNPIMIRGGIPCINSTQMVSNIAKYLAIAGNVKYWAIEMGTNDAWGGTNANAAIFKSNLQTIITACKNAGIIPILSRTLATNSTAATWQVHQDFLDAIDSLTKNNELIAGPDFYTWFLNHPEELNTDGVHPNATGAASIQRLWAAAVSTIYTTQAVDEKQSNTRQLALFPNPTKGSFQLSGIQKGNLRIFDLNGKLVYTQISVVQSKDVNTNLSSGIYVVEVRDEGKVYTAKLLVQ